MAQMQLVQSPWLFVLGSEGKTSLAQQYALEHRLTHLNEPSEVTWRQLLGQPVMVEGSVDLLRELETTVKDVTLVWVGPDCSEAEAQALREYEAIGKGRRVSRADYSLFRKQLYPRLVMIYNPDRAQNQFIAKAYLEDSGLKCVFDQIDANQILSKLPKHSSYVLFNFTPSPQELAVLEPFFNLKLIHVRHDRTQLGNHHAHFDTEAHLLPPLQKKHYFRSVSGQQGQGRLLEQLRPLLTPQLVYFHVREEAQREAVLRHAEESHTPIISLKQAEKALEKREHPAPKDKLYFLSRVILSHLEHSSLYLIDCPSEPEHFGQLEQRTAPLHQFIDATRPEQHEITREPTAPIHYLDCLKRKVVDTSKPLGPQLSSRPRYYVVTGAGSCGKTSASRSLASRFGFRNIEYEQYLASLKEKLLAPEDGEELPFAKVIAHFAPLISSSGPPLLIDGLALEAKQAEKWVASNGAPHIINLNVSEDESIRRGRKKAQVDVAAEITEEDRAKAKQLAHKSTQLISSLGGVAVHEVDFSEPLILAEERLRQVLTPKVYLVQANKTLAFQNLAIRHNFGYYNLDSHPLDQLPAYLNANQLSAVILGNYRHNSQELICQDFSWIEKHVGPIRYMAIWEDEPTEVNEEQLQLERPPQEEKPKPVEGEEGEPPAGGEEEPKKKGLSIYDFRWTKAGSHKNMSQWFLQQKKGHVKQQILQIGELVGGGFAGAGECLGSSQDQAVYARIKM